ncbi:MAG: cytochrome c peroxidase [bacterium]
MRHRVVGIVGLVGLAALVSSCGGSASSGGQSGSQSLDQRVEKLCASNNLKGSPQLTEPGLTAAQSAIRDKRRELGRLLFFDHALSGVEQTSCATCHHAAFQFSDARNIARGVFCDLIPELSITCHDAPTPGENGNVVGPDRTSPLNSRNTPSLIDNVLYPRLMWNGRFRFNDTRGNDVNLLDPSLGFRMPSPEGDLFTRSLLAAQAEIPVTELVEMTGDFPHFDGKIEEDAEEAHDEVRDGIAGRLDFIPAYRSLFEEAYPADRPDLRLSDFDPEVGPNDDLTYAAVGDAIGHFMESLVMTDAPFDHYLTDRDRSAISEAAKRGAEVFMDKGRCSSCHAGDLFSDFENHNIGVPQVGPGTGFGSPHDPAYAGKTNWDFGLEEITTNREDRFKFRTPPLRGVALTSPYMHNGAYTSLADAIRHHTDPATAYAAYDITQIEPDMQAYGLNPSAPVFDSINPVELGHGPGQTRIDLSEAQIADLVEFLKALTDPRMLDTASLAPTSVPSGLPLDVPGPRRFPVLE